MKLLDSFLCFSFLSFLVISLHGIASFHIFHAGGFLGECTTYEGMVDGVLRVWSLGVGWLADSIAISPLHLLYFLYSVYMTTKIYRPVNVISIKNTLSAYFTALWILRVEYATYNCETLNLDIEQYADKLI